MKKIISFLMSVFLLFSLSACGNGNGNQLSEERNTEKMMTESQDASVQTKQDGTENTNSRILIAYFSVPEDVDTDGVDAVSGASIVVKDNEVMGNTEYVAKTIQKTIGGDLFRIETVDKYPLDHETLVNQAADEQDDSARPELAALLKILKDTTRLFWDFPTGGVIYLCRFIPFWRNMILEQRRLFHLSPMEAVVSLIHVIRFPSYSLGHL